MNNNNLLFLVKEGRAAAKKKSLFVIDPKRHLKTPVFPPATPANRVSFSNIYINRKTKALYGCPERDQKARKYMT